MTAALKPCHNLLCRSTEIIVEDYLGRSPSYKAKIFYHCSCSRCGIEGPDGDTKEEAIRLWNLPIHPAETALRDLITQIRDAPHIFDRMTGDVWKAFQKAKEVLKDD